MFASVRAYLPVARPAFTVLAFGFFGAFAYLNRDVIGLVLSQAQPGLLLVALALLVLSHLLAPFHAQAVLRTSRLRPGYGLCFAVHARRLPARYVPGGVWHMVAKVADFHAYGVSARFLTAIVVLQAALINGFSFLLGGLGVAAFGDSQWWTYGGLASAAAGAVAIGAAVWGTNTRLLAGPERITTRGYAVVAASTLGALVVFSAGFVAYVLALPGVAESAGVWEIFFVVLFARGVGFIAFFAPKGIGVFEAVAAGILAGHGEFGAAVVVFAGFRALGFVADVLVWGLGYGVALPPKPSAT